MCLLDSLARLLVCDCTIVNAAHVFQVAEAPQSSPLHDTAANKLLIGASLSTGRGIKLIGQIQQGLNLLCFAWTGGVTCQPLIHITEEVKISGEHNVCGSWIYYIAAVVYWTAVIYLYRIVGSLIVFVTECNLFNSMCIYLLQDL